MPRPPGAQFLEVQFWHQLDGQTIINNYHYALDAGGFPETLAAAETEAQAFFDNVMVTPLYQGAFTAAMEFTKVSVQLIHPVRKAKGYAFPVGALNGLRAGTPMPSSTQTSVETRSDLGGSKGHGGTRFAGSVITDIADSEFTPAYLADLMNGVGALYGTPAWGVPAKLPIIFNRATPGQSEVIHAADPKVEVRTMRRRVVGRGI